MFFHFEETISIFKLLLIDNESFYRTLNFIEMNNLVLFGIILSTLSSILLFTKEFELKKFTIFHLLWHLQFIFVFYILLDMVLL